MRRFEFDMPLVPNRKYLGPPPSHRGVVRQDDLFSGLLILCAVLAVAYVINWFENRYKYYLCEVCHKDTGWICLTCNACYEHCCCEPDDPPEEEDRAA